MRQQSHVNFAAYYSLPVLFYLFQPSYSLKVEKTLPATDFTLPINAVLC